MSKGFTLIELIIVILIIGIMSQMAIPRYEKRIELNKEIKTSKNKKTRWRSQRKYGHQYER